MCESTAAVPPGLGEDAVWRRIRQSPGHEPSEQLRIDFTEEVVGNGSGVQSELMTAIEEWIAANDPGAGTLPVISPPF